MKNIVTAIFVVLFFSGFSQVLERKKTPMDMLNSDIKLLKFYEGAMTFDSLYFKDFCRDSLDKLRILIKEESFLTGRYFDCISVYQNAKFFREKKRGKALQATEDLNKFYEDELLPLLAEIKKAYNSFAAQERKRKREAGIFY